MKPIIVGLLFISLGMTSFAALPMNVSAENNLTSVNEEEKITDLEKIHNILYKNLSEQKLTREVSLFEDSNGKDVNILVAAEKEDTARLIGRYGIVANSLREIISVAGRSEDRRIFLRFESFDDEKED